MAFGVSVRRAAVLSEQLLITRIVTSSLLTLLLILGVAGFGHGPAEEDAGQAAAHLVLDAAVGETTAPSVESSTPATGGDAGLALCVAGLVCAAIALLLLRRLRPAAVAVAVTRTSLPPLALCPLVPLLQAHRSPLALGISRT